MTSMFDQDLPQTPANYAAMTPLTCLERTAQVYPDRLAVVHGTGPDGPDRPGARLTNAVVNWPVL